MKLHDKVKNTTKTAITRGLWTNLGQFTALQRVWLNRFTGSQPFHYPQKLCNQKETHLKFVNNPPFYNIETEDQQPAQAERS